MLGSVDDRGPKNWLARHLSQSSARNVKARAVGGSVGGLHGLGLDMYGVLAGIWHACLRLRTAFAYCAVSECRV